jgi:hypothetical protein
MITNQATNIAYCIDIWDNERSDIVVIPKILRVAAIL